MQQPEIPLDLDHNCKEPWPISRGHTQKMPRYEPTKCPACCYIRGWQDKETADEQN